jgi:hypothetical protein
MSVVSLILITSNKEMENEMPELTDLEIEIATELGCYDFDGTGHQFWAEVLRLATFGENWAEHWNA